MNTGSTNNNQPVQPAQPAAVNLMLSKLIFVCITNLAGIAGFIYFIYAANYYATVSCFALEFVTYHVVRLNSIAIDGKLKEKYNVCGLWGLFITAIVVGVASYACALGNAALGGIYSQGFQMEKDGYYVCIIPCTVALLWSIVLAVDSKSYMRDLQAEQEDREVLHRRGATNLRRFF